MSSVSLHELLSENGLLDRAEKVEDSLYKLTWGSAHVVIGVTDHALVVIAPMFRSVPPGDELAFFHRLLQANSALGGMAAFAIQPDGWVVLQSGRDLAGLDADELALIVTTVARAADELDDVLHREFFAKPGSGEKPAEEASGEKPAEEASDA